MPADINALREVFAAHDYVFTEHASDRAVEREIASHKVEECIANGQVIEDYPDDKYGPSCLIVGSTKTSRALHIQVSYPPGVKIITVYEPSPDEWEEGFQKRKSG